MHLTRRIIIQLAVFSVVALTGATVMALDYIHLPALLFGVGHYRVTAEFPAAGGLYASGNVTYRGTEVGRVESVHLTDTGVEAVLSLKSGVDIPSDLDAAVHSQTAIGEQFVELVPRSGNAPPLKDGDVIPVNRTSVPPDVNDLLDATNRGLQAISRDNLKTTIDESYTAVAGLGPDISRLVKGSTALAIAARKTLDPVLALIDQSKPVLDSQTDTADSVQAYAAHLAAITSELKNNDSALAGVVQKGAPAANEVQATFDRLQPSLPILLSNLVSLGQVAVTYQPALEQILVLLPQAAADVQAVGVPNLNTKQPYKGRFLSFNLNVNLPPACTTGFLPVQQQRAMSLEDYPDRPGGDLYCRVPQDSPLNVRGARNTPCITRPGKRAPTVKMCESDENYVPLNDGFNWKGDPNATLSGQSIPQLPPGTPSADAASGINGATPPQAPPPPLAVAQYDPATGTYVGPDGHVYTQANLGRAAKEQTWQTMLLPPHN